MNTHYPTIEVVCGARGQLQVVRCDKFSCARCFTDNEREQDEKQYVLLPERYVEVCLT